MAEYQAENVTLRFATVHNGYFQLKDKRSGPHEGIGGVDYELLTVLSKALNFNYELVVPEDEGWGSPNPDGSWTGMIGMLLKNEADAALNGVTITSDRSKVIQFGFPYLLDSENFAMMKAGTLPKDLVYFYPFQLPVWMCLLMTTLLCSFSLAFFHFSMKKRKNRSLGTFFLNMIAAAEVLFGFRNVKKFACTLPDKVLFAFAGLCMSVLSLSFNCMLLSFLMAPLMENQIKTFEELAKACLKGEAKVTVYDGTALQFMLMNEEEGLYKELGENLRKNPDSAAQSDSDEMEKILKGYTSIREKNDMKILVFGTGEPENFFMSEETLNSAFLGIAFRKGFDLVYRFNEMILRVYQGGIYQKIVDDTLLKVRLKGDKKRKANAEGGVRPISIPDIIGIFWLIIPGYLMSILILMIERYCKPKKKKTLFRKRKVTKSKRNVKVFPRKEKTILAYDSLYD